MSERGRYKTKQQDLILECLEKQKWHFLTVSQLMDCLREKGVVVEQTTVYQALERMINNGKMMKLPMEDGTKVHYCFTGEEDWDKLGKLVCIGCGHLIPLECSKMVDFLEHIYKEHGFGLDQKHAILYGYCECCNNKKSVPRISLRWQNGLSYESFVMRCILAGILIKLCQYCRQGSYQAPKLISFSNSEIGRGRDKATVYQLSLT